MAKASPALTTTPAGNRTLLQIQKNMGELRVALFSKMNEYVRAHGHLDAGFDREMMKYLQDNPLFSQRELSHPELLGAPAAPADTANNKAAYDQWVHDMGLRPGDSVRTPSGKYIKVQ
jgi:hypothetical protein